MYDQDKLSIPLDCMLAMSEDGQCESVTFMGIIWQHPVRKTPWDEFPGNDDSPRHSAACFVRAVDQLPTN